MLCSLTLYSSNPPKPTEDDVTDSNTDPIIGLLKTFSRFGNSRELFLSITGTISTICRQDTFSEDDDEDDDSIQGFSQPLIGSGFILIMVEILSIVLNRILKTSKNPISFFQTYSKTTIELLKNLPSCSSPYQHLKLLIDQSLSIYNSTPSLRLHIITFLLYSIYLVICDKKIISSGRTCFMKKYPRWNSSLERIDNLDHEKMQKIEIIDEQESKMICDLLGEFGLNFGFDQGFESGELEKGIEVTKELLVDYFGDEEELKKILRSSRFLIYAMNQFNQWEETGSIDSSIHIDEEVLIEALEDSDTNMIQAGIFIILSSSVPLESRNFKLIDCLATCSVTIFSAELRFLCFRTLVHLIDSLEFKTKFDSFLHLFNTSSKYIKLEKALVNLVKEKMAGSLGKATEDQKFWWSKEWVLRVPGLIDCTDGINSQNLELVIEKVNFAYFLLRSDFETQTGIKNDEMKEMITRNLIIPASQFSENFQIDKEVDDEDKSKVLMMLNSLRFSLSLINSIE
ncbi:uncharacterized protein MELLADRAFT_112276 [Melampsora larici-populina 98AG31]|uniref:Uncharacterized protein n=1 Tax=Melampsora larici-populina (strain 98AG31 / pathotype 3-4-7) TaxID=747676 RepID=F4S5Y7_MELLP|nr:uncharacterized protein MELLADRAFT_112276 [Melampsora larici-populina 98AG31]EGF99985.1 hypothetical protein MELLADRAFT_112276 [Melampsora larici-populina 98AG31]